MTAAEPSRRQRRGTRRRRQTVAWLVAVVAVLLVGVVAWIGIRGLLAKSEVEAAGRLASALNEQILDHEMDDLNKTAAALSVHAERAAALTGDPIWRLAEWVPLAGPNLTAIRELTEVIDNLSSDAVGPLTGLAVSIDMSSFKPVDGVIAMEPLVAARPAAEQASTAIYAAQKSLASIRTDIVVEPIRAATLLLDGQLAATATPVDAIRTASVLLPDMLGAAGPRNFLLLFQNPAELRASGGIPGALALMHVDSGRVDLVQQAAASDFDRFESPVLPLADSTRSLYGDITGEFMQNVNLTPQFPLSAALAREMWTQKFGTDVSGVISIDPVALGYLLEATGPVTLATGDVLSAENAVTLLLQDAYVRYSKPAQQDLFFAAVASAVFEKVADGDFEPSKLIDGLAKSGAERRILLWSSVEAEQDELEATTLAGALPVTTPDVQPFGVYFNDATASKMDFYLDVHVADGHVVCRKDERPQFMVAVNLTNTAPADAPSTFPEYVTGGGVFGVRPGNIKTLVNVYGTPELQNLGVVRDGEVVPYLPATDFGYQVSQIAIELAPGESTTVQFGFLGERPFAGEIVTEQTPVINRHETQKMAPSCEFPLW